MIHVRFAGLFLSLPASECFRCHIGSLSQFVTKEELGNVHPIVLLKRNFYNFGAPRFVISKWKYNEFRHSGIFEGRGSAHDLPVESQ